MVPTDSDITVLLQAHRAGDADAFSRLVPLLYDELRRIARGRLRRERDGHTLQATEIVHEAFLKLAASERVDWTSRSHFFAVASRAMRQVLIDHAVRRGAAKRGSGAGAVTLDDQAAATQRPLDEIIELDRALARLEAVDARQARVVECRYFGGLSIEETAAALGLSEATVSRDWAFARAWLHDRLVAAPSPRSGP
jgi:RNA polymerase sigma factor (TIGR02999 family)